MNEQDFETLVAEALRALAEQDAAGEKFVAWQQRHGRWNPTPDCPPLPRFCTAFLRDDWTGDELAHMGDCDYCQRVKAMTRETIWHPTIHELFRLLLGSLTAPDAEDVTYHLQTDCCCCCKCLVKWLQPLAELVRSDNRAAERAAATLAETFAGWGRLRLDTCLADESRPPFQLDVAREDGTLSVTVRETDAGELLAHVLSPDPDRAGQIVRVELSGSEGKVDSKEVILEPREQDGCGGCASFGRFADIAEKLGSECAVVAAVVPGPTEASSTGSTPPAVTDPSPDPFLGAAQDAAMAPDDASAGDIGQLHTSMPNECPAVIPFVMKSDDRAQDVEIRYVDWTPLNAMVAGDNASLEVIIPVKRFSEEMREALPWVEAVRLVCLPNDYGAESANYKAWILAGTGEGRRAVCLILEWPGPIQRVAHLHSDSGLCGWLSDTAPLPSRQSRIVMHLLPEE